MRLLLAEDESVLADQVKRLLANEGHAVDIAQDGDEALKLGSTESYDMVVMNIGLPKRDGISVLKSWRQHGTTVPVLILTARDAWTDCVQGLDAGADDYMTKPFHMQELAARVRALLRRSAGHSAPIFRCGRVAYEMRTGRTTVDGSSVDLTSQEAAVLAYLVHNSGRLVSRKELSEHIYEYDADRDSNTIAVFVTRLRKKLGAELIKTVRGRGYMVDELQ